MAGIGFDCGTYNLVCCKRNEKNELEYKREVNAFIEMPIDNRFVFNMMKDAGVPLIERADAGVAYALGEAAVNIAYTMNNVELKRPMKDGCLNPKEKYSQQIMSIMMHSLINKSDDGEPVYYSVPANAINEETDSDYHGKVLEAIFKAFKDDDDNKVTPFPINEGLALVYSELKKKAYTGIGISWGAGMVNVCFANSGFPVFQFSVVNSGDWIDKMAAKATGETPTFINQEKLKVDLSKDSDSLVQRAIKAQYEIMVQKTVTEIKRGLEESNNKARNPGHPIDIVISGGSSSPNGFRELFSDIVKKAHLPIEMGEIIRPKDPLYSVARGCLFAAENSMQ
jgi:hypothetical protein